MSENIKTQRENLILQSLKGKTYQKISPHLEDVPMPLGQLIYRPDEKITHLYFPETSIISVVTYLENGSCVETGVIGYEGVAGIEAILNKDSSPREAMVQLAGVGKRIEVKQFREFFESERLLTDQIMNYVYQFIAQISQNPACLCYHSVEKRLARWILTFQDRAISGELQLTQEYIAVMLGVHRPSVSRCAAKLQEQGLINYYRGKIKVLDREGLKKAACECYETIREFSGISAD